LVEPVPYNLVSQSEVFTAWIAQNATISANVTTAPNGTLTADKLIPNTTLAQHRIFNPASVGEGVYSVYAKADGYNFLSLGIGGGLGYATIIFDILNGTISGTAFATTPTITSVGNGWYRCAVYNPNLGPGGSVSAFIVARNANSTADYVGDGTSGVFIWGAQVVEGTSARDYQMTETRLNIPRLDYSLGSCPNILLEPQRTNLALRSEEFNDASWVKNAVNVTANSTTSPSGIVNADTMTGSGLIAARLVSQVVTLTSGTSYAATFYVKKSTNDFVQIYTFNATGGHFANFDINSGAVGSVGTTFGSNPTSSITSVGNGWYRCSMVLSAAVTASSGFGIALVSSSTSARLEANTLTTSVFLWGAQLEAGAYATSYIPTTSASVTRNADVISRGNIFTNGMITASGGTWFLDFRNNLPILRSSILGALFLDTSSSTPTNGFLFIGGLNGQRLIIYKTLSGVVNQLFITTTNSIKVAIKWNGTTADVFVNGVKVVAATAFTPTAMENILANGIDTPKYINSMALYNTPISDTECIAITTL
jgi:hypothetical protein